MVVQGVPGGLSAADSGAAKDWGSGVRGVEPWQGGGLPLKDESQHGDGRQQKEGQGPQDGPDHQGESLGKLGGQLTWKTSSPESQMG